MIIGVDADNEGYSVVLHVKYPEHSSRILALLGALLFVKWILLVPHIIVLNVLGIVQAIVIYIGYWAVLITGSYPRNLFNFGVAVQGWNLRVAAWMNGWVDSYPPFRFS